MSQMLAQRTRVCIIGGGISGLATAYLLAADRRFAVDLIETEARLGGAVYTMQVELPDGTPRWVDMGGQRLQRHNLHEARRSDG